MKTKRIISVLLVLVLTLSLTLSLCAADTAVGTSSIQVIVKNKSGVTLTDEKSGKEAKIPYGTTLTSLMYSSKGAQVEYQNLFGYIAADDLAAKDEFFDINQAVSGDKHTLYFFDKNGTQLLKGPADFYGSTGYTVPSGTEISYTLTDKAVTWAYYDDGANTGWVQINSAYGNRCSVALDYTALTYDTSTTGKFMTARDSLVMTDDPYNGKELTTLPASTVCTYKFALYIYEEDDISSGSYSSVAKKYYYTEYSGKKGWVLDDLVSDRCIAYASQKYNLVNPYYQRTPVYGTAPVYDEVFGEKKLGTIDFLSAGTLYSDYTLYTDDYNWYYISYGGTSGWVDGYEFEIESNRNTYQTKHAASDTAINLYSKPFRDAKKCGTIPAGVDYTADRSYTSGGTKWLYCEYGAVSGWAPETDGEETAAEETTEETTAETTAAETTAQSKTTTASPPFDINKLAKPLIIALGAVLVSALIIAFVKFISSHRKRSSVTRKIKRSKRR